MKRLIRVNEDGTRTEISGPRSRTGPPWPVTVRHADGTESIGLTYSASERGYTRYEP